MMMPSPEQIAAMQRQLAIDAEKAGMSVPEFIGAFADIPPKHIDRD